MESENLTSVRSLYATENKEEFRNTPHRQSTKNSNSSNAENLAVKKEKEGDEQDAEGEQNNVLQDCLPPHPSQHLLYHHESAPLGAKAKISSDVSSSVSTFIAPVTPEPEKRNVEEEGEVVTAKMGVSSPCTPSPDGVVVPAVPHQTSIISVPSRVFSSPTTPDPSSSSAGAAAEVSALPYPSVFSPPLQEEMELLPSILPIPLASSCVYYGGGERGLRGLHHGRKGLRRRTSTTASSEGQSTTTTSSSSAPPVPAYLQPDMIVQPNLYFPGEYLPPSAVSAGVPSCAATALAATRRVVTSKRPPDVVSSSSCFSVSSSFSVYSGTTNLTEIGKRPERGKKLSDKWHHQQHPPNYRSHHDKCSSCPLPSEMEDGKPPLVVGEGASQGDANSKGPSSPSSFHHTKDNHHHHGGGTSLPQSPFVISPSSAVPHPHPYGGSSSRSTGRISNPSSRPSYFSSMVSDANKTGSSGISHRRRLGERNESKAGRRRRRRSDDGEDEEQEKGEGEGEAEEDNEDGKTSSDCGASSLLPQQSIWSASPGASSASCFLRGIGGADAGMANVSGSGVVGGGGGSFPIPGDGGRRDSISTDVRRNSELKSEDPVEKRKAAAAAAAPGGVGDNSHNGKTSSARQPQALPPQPEQHKKPPPQEMKTASGGGGMEKGGKARNSNDILPHDPSSPFPTLPPPPAPLPYNGVMFKKNASENILLKSEPNSQSAIHSSSSSSSHHTRPPHSHPHTDRMSASALVVNSAFLPLPSTSSSSSGPWTDVVEGEEKESQRGKKREEGEEGGKKKKVDASTCSTKNNMNTSSRVIFNPPPTLHLVEARQNPTNEGGNKSEEEGEGSVNPNRSTSEVKDGPRYSCFSPPRNFQLLDKDIQSYHVSAYLPPEGLAFLLPHYYPLPHLANNGEGNAHGAKWSNTRAGDNPLMYPSTIATDHQHHNDLNDAKNTTTTTDNNNNNNHMSREDFSESVNMDPDDPQSFMENTSRSRSGGSTSSTSTTIRRRRGGGSLRCRLRRRRGSSCSSTNSSSTSHHNNNNNANNNNGNSSVSSNIPLKWRRYSNSSQSSRMIGQRSRSGSGFLAVSASSIGAGGEEGDDDHHHTVAKSVTLSTELLPPAFASMRMGVNTGVSITPEVYGDSKNPTLPAVGKLNSFSSLKSSSLPPPLSAAGGGSGELRGGEEEGVTTTPLYSSAKRSFHTTVGGSGVFSQPSRPCSTAGGGSTNLPHRYTPPIGPIVGVECSRSLRGKNHSLTSTTTIRAAGNSVSPSPSSTATMADPAAAPAPEGGGDGGEGWNSCGEHSLHANTASHLRYAPPPSSSSVASIASNTIPDIPVGSIGGGGGGEATGGGGGGGAGEALFAVPRPRRRSVVVTSPSEWSSPSSSPTATSSSSRQRTDLPPSPPPPATTLSSSTENNGGGGSGKEKEEIEEKHRKMDHSTHTTTTSDDNISGGGPASMSSRTAVSANKSQTETSREAPVRKVSETTTPVFNKENSRDGGGGGLVEEGSPTIYSLFSTLGDTKTSSTYGSSRKEFRTLPPASAAAATSAVFRWDPFQITPPTPSSESRGKGGGGSSITSSVGAKSDSTSNNNNPLSEVGSWGTWSAAGKSALASLHPSPNHSPSFWEERRRKEKSSREKEEQEEVQGRGQGTEKEVDGIGGGRPFRSAGFPPLIPPPTPPIYPSAGSPTHFFPTDPHGAVVLARSGEGNDDDHHQQRQPHRNSGNASSGGTSADAGERRSGNLVPAPPPFNPQYGRDGEYGGTENCTDQRYHPHYRRSSSSSSNHDDSNHHNDADDGGGVVEGVMTVGEGVGQGRGVVNAATGMPHGALNSLYRRHTLQNLIHISDSATNHTPHLAEHWTGGEGGVGAGGGKRTENENSGSLCYRRHPYHHHNSSYASPKLWEGYGYDESEKSSPGTSSSMGEPFFPIIPTLSPSSSFYREGAGGGSEKEKGVLGGGGGGNITYSNAEHTISAGGNGLRTMMSPISTLSHVRMTKKKKKEENHQHPLPPHPTTSFSAVSSALSSPFSQKSCSSQMGDKLLAHSEFGKRWGSRHKSYSGCSSSSASSSNNNTTSRNSSNSSASNSHPYREHNLATTNMTPTAFVPVPSKTPEQVAQKPPPLYGPMLPFPSSSSSSSSPSPTTPTSTTCTTTRTASSRTIARSKSRSGSHHCSTTPGATPTSYATTAPITTPMMAIANLFHRQGCGNGAQRRMDGGGSGGTLPPPLPFSMPVEGHEERKTETDSGEPMQGRREGGVGGGDEVPFTTSTTNSNGYCPIPLSSGNRKNPSHGERWRNTTSKNPLEKEPGERGEEDEEDEEKKKKGRERRENNKRRKKCGSGGKMVEAVLQGRRQSRSPASSASITSLRDGGGYSNGGSEEDFRLSAWLPPDSSPSSPRLQFLTPLHTSSQHWKSVSRTASISPPSFNSTRTMVTMTPSTLVDIVPISTMKRVPLSSSSRTNTTRRSGTAEVLEAVEPSQMLDTSARCRTIPKSPPLGASPRIPSISFPSSHLHHPPPSPGAASPLPPPSSALGSLLIPTLPSSPTRPPSYCTSSTLKSVLESIPFFPFQYLSVQQESRTASSTTFTPPTDLAAPVVVQQQQQQQGGGGEGGRGIESEHLAQQQHEIEAEKEKSQSQGDENDVIELKGKLFWKNVEGEAKTTATTTSIKSVPPPRPPFPSPAVGVAVTPRQGSSTSGEDPPRKEEPPRGTFLHPSSPSPPPLPPSSLEGRRRGSSKGSTSSSSGVSVRGGPAPPGVHHVRYLHRHSSIPDEEYSGGGEAQKTILYVEEGGESEDGEEKPLASQGFPLSSSPASSSTFTTTTPSPARPCPPPIPFFPGLSLSKRGSEVVEGRVATPGVGDGGGGTATHGLPSPSPSPPLPPSLLSGVSFPIHSTSSSSSSSTSSFAPPLSLIPLNHFPPPHHPHHPRPSFSSFSSCRSSTSSSSSGACGASPASHPEILPSQRTLSSIHKLPHPPLISSSASYLPSSTTGAAPGGVGGGGRRRKSSGPSPSFLEKRNSQIEEGNKKEKLEMKDQHQQLQQQVQEKEEKEREAAIATAAVTIGEMKEKDEEEKKENKVKNEEYVHRNAHTTPHISTNDTNTNSNNNNSSHNRLLSSSPFSYILFRRNSSLTHPLSPFSDSHQGSIPSVSQVHSIRSPGDSYHHDQYSSITVASTTAAAVPTPSPSSSTLPSKLVALIKSNKTGAEVELRKSAGTFPLPLHPSSSSSCIHQETSTSATGTSQQEGNRGNALVSPYASAYTALGPSLLRPPYRPPPTSSSSSASPPTKKEGRERETETEIPPPVSPHHESKTSKQSEIKKKKEGEKERENTNLLIRHAGSRCESLSVVSVKGTKDNGTNDGHTSGVTRGSEKVEVQKINTDDVGGAHVPIQRIPSTSGRNIQSLVDIGSLDPRPPPPHEGGNREKGDGDDAVNKLNRGKDSLGGGEEVVETSSFLSSHNNPLLANSMNSFTGFDGTFGGFLLRSPGASGKGKVGSGGGVGGGGGGKEREAAALPIAVTPSQMSIQSILMAVSSRKSSMHSNLFLPNANMASKNGEGDPHGMNGGTIGNTTGSGGVQQQVSPSPPPNSLVGGGGGGGSGTTKGFSPNFPRRRRWMPPPLSAMVEEGGSGGGVARGSVLGGGSGAGFPLPSFFGPSSTTTKRKVHQRLSSVSPRSGGVVVLDVEDLPQRGRDTPGEATSFHPVSLFTKFESILQSGGGDGGATAAAGLSIMSSASTGANESPVGSSPFSQPSPSSFFSASRNAFPGFAPVTTQHTATPYTSHPHRGSDVLPQRHRSAKDTDDVDEKTRGGGGGVLKIEGSGEQWDGRKKNSALFSGLNFGVGFSPQRPLFARQSYSLKSDFSLAAGGGSGSGNLKDTSNDNIYGKNVFLFPPPTFATGSEESIEQDNISRTSPSARTSRQQQQKHYSHHPENTPTKASRNSPSGADGSGGGAGMGGFPHADSIFSSREMNIAQLGFRANTPTPQKRKRSRMERRRLRELQRQSSFVYDDDEDDEDDEDQDYYRNDEDEEDDLAGTISRKPRFQKYPVLRFLRKQAGDSYSLVSRDVLGFSTPSSTSVCDSQLPPSAGPYRSAGQSSVGHAAIRGMGPSEESSLLSDPRQAVTIRIEEAKEVSMSLSAGSSAMAASTDSAVSFGTAQPSSPWMMTTTMPVQQHGESVGDPPGGTFVLIGGGGESLSHPPPLLEEKKEEKEEVGKMVEEPLEDGKGAQMLPSPLSITNFPPPPPSHSLSPSSTHDAKKGGGGGSIVVIE